MRGKTVLRTTSSLLRTLGDDVLRAGEDLSMGTPLVQGAILSLEGTLMLLVTQSWTVLEKAALTPQTNHPNTGWSQPTTERVIRVRGQQMAWREMSRTAAGVTS
jgi:hypothetical protein